MTPASFDHGAASEDDRLFTESEAALILRVSPDTLRRLRIARPPKIGHIIVGERSPRYRRTHIDTYLASQERTTSDEAASAPNDPIEAVSIIPVRRINTAPAAPMPSFTREREGFYLLAKQTFSGKGAAS
jgi:hypothetical protein